MSEQKRSCCIGKFLVFLVVALVTVWLLLSCSDLFDATNVSKILDFLKTVIPSMIWPGFAVFFCHKYGDRLFKVIEKIKLLQAGAFIARLEEETEKLEKIVETTTNPTPAELFKNAKNMLKEKKYSDAIREGWRAIEKQLSRNFGTTSVENAMAQVEEKNGAEIRNQIELMKRIALEYYEKIPEEIAERRATAFINATETVIQVLES
ncbi:MAG: hypothetical protein LBU39_08660 [Desulfobulbaceae bacterium]|jgi:hypothetical protein|nr:hypothetical protein [Desulfobulbaceae bacterium]